jgi:hypothetical protein
MNTLKIAAIAAAMTFSFGVAHADEILLTSGVAKRGASVSVDYVSDGTAAGIELHLKLPAGGDVDTSRFATNLPKDFVLHSNVVDGKLIALVVSDTNALLPTGIISLGVVTSKNGSGSFSLEQVAAADPVGKSVAVKTTATDASK